MGSLKEFGQVGAGRRSDRTHRGQVYAVRYFKGVPYSVTSRTDFEFLQEYGTLRNYFIHEFDGVNSEAAREWRKSHRMRLSKVYR